MATGGGRLAVLISRQLPEPAVQLARSRAEVDAYAKDAPMPRAELLARVRSLARIKRFLNDVLPAWIDWTIFTGAWFFLDGGLDGTSLLLFARLRSSDRAFWFLGPATYVGHEG